LADIVSERVAAEDRYRGESEDETFHVRTPRLDEAKTQRKPRALAQRAPSQLAMWRCRETRGQPLGRPPHKFL
jgi:hypothetical protein